jgi:hypothetical protein
MIQQENVLSKFRCTPVFEAVWNAINENIVTEVFDKSTLKYISVSQRKYKLIEEVGGSRSSKTWSNFQICFLYSWSYRNKTIIVLRDKASDCRDKVETEWRDWLRDPMLRIKEHEEGLITVDQLDEYLKKEDLTQFLTENKTNHTWTFPSGSVITFTGVDDENKAIGKSAHVVWVNEPYKFPEEVFKQLYMRVKDFMLWDWNPKQGHYIENKRLLDNTFTHRSNLTMNPFCPKTSRDEILQFQPIKYCALVVDKILEEQEARLYDADLNPNEYTKRQLKELVRCQRNELNKTASEFDWLVYGLGEKGERPNRVLSGWKKIPRKQYDDLNSTEYIGNDWGKNHNWGILGAKYYDGALYLREMNYVSEVEIMKSLPLETLQEFKKQESKEGENLGIVSWMFAKLGINKKQTIVCDNNRPLKISMLRRCGWDYAVGAQKGQGSIKDGLDLLQSLEVYFTDDSPNLENEYENYSYIVDRYGVVTDEPEDANNHCFIGETLIHTESGLRRIDSINEGDLVLTSNGFKPVLNRFNNGKKQVSVYLIQFDTFSVSLHCTENHLIKCGNNWTKVSELKQGQTIYLCNDSMEKNTTYTQMKDTFQEGVKECTLLYGNQSTEELRKDFMYTTKTRTLGTTGLKTSNVLSQENIYQITEKRGLSTIQNGRKNFMLKALKARKNGIQSMKVESGIKNKVLKRGSVENIKNANAFNVPLNMRQGIQENQNFVQTTVNQHTEGNQDLMMLNHNALNAVQYSSKTNIQGLKIVQLSVLDQYESDVYDLMVDECHEYFANGILVHNCIDPARYICQYLVRLGLLKRV